MNSYSQWARAALQFPNMAFLIIDTTGISKDADIIRIHVATTTGPIYDQLLWSERHRTSNEKYTGIPEDPLMEAPTLPEEWQHVRDVLSSHYVICYNLDFVQERLDENAAHYGLQPFTLIGDDLQHTAVEYFRGGYNLKLSEACQRIGHTMPTPPSAPDRAQGQLALLKAMAEGVTGTQKKRETEDPRAFWEPTWILNGRSDVYLSEGAHKHPDVIHQRDEGTYLYLDCDYTETKEGDTTRYTLTDGTVFILKGAQFYIEGEEGYGAGEAATDHPF